MRDTERQAVNVWLATLDPMQLVRLRDALACDSPRLIQRMNTDPPAIHGLKSARCYATCLMGFPLLDAMPEATSEQVDQYIASVSAAIEPWRFALIAGAWDYSDSWHNSNREYRPRAEAIAAFLPEVDAHIRGRAA